MMGPAEEQSRHPAGESGYDTGWRAWAVDLRDPNRPVLQGLFKPEARWLPRERHTSTCDKTAPWRPWHGLIRRPAHGQTPPGAGCVCGLHAMLHPASAIEYLDDWESYIQRQHQYRRRHILAARYGTARPLPAFGRVAIWGEVIEQNQGLLHTNPSRGLRGEHGHPLELWLPAQWWETSAYDAAEVASQLKKTYGIEAHPIVDLADLQMVWAALEDVEGEQLA